jgi:hypothetical protein
MSQCAGQMPCPPGSLALRKDSAGDARMSTEGTASAKGNLGPATHRTSHFTGTSRTVTLYFPALSTQPLV